MQIKIIRNGIESEWFELTKKEHRELMRNKPDAVIVLIDEFYPDSPNRGELVELDFALFTLLARKFVLEQNRQDKRIERNHDKRPLDEIIAVAETTVEDEYIKHETIKMIHRKKACLTPPQQRRITLYVEEKLSYSKIGEMEGVSYKAVSNSVKAGLKKLKKFSRTWF